MDYLPLFLDLKGKRCLVVGGDSVALRKIRLLCAAGARLRVVAPEIHHEIYTLLSNQQHELIKRNYQASDLEAVQLVIAATDSDDVNTKVSEDAQQRNLFVNVVDGADQGNAIMPAIIDRSPILVAISSAGKAPVLSRMLRTRLESTIPQAYGQLAILAGRFRDEVKQRFSSLSERRGFWERIFSGPVAEQVLSGNLGNAEDMLTRQLQDPDQQTPGEVYLVGGGPGDPDLLTFRALRLMQQADIVLYDRLVSKAVLELCRRDADYLYVGKRKDHHALPQEQINQKLVELAVSGKRVLRLKGGDPFIFGRGGEEIDTLAANNVPFQVVPGITAASGCASYAGIPLTHRDHAQSVRFVTGHLKNGTCNLKWSELAAPDQTLVFYMGLTGLDVICSNLIAHGCDQATPVALIQQGTTSNQRVFTGTLASIGDVLIAEDVKPPTLIIVGSVVNLQERLSWFNPEKGVSAGSLSWFPPKNVTI